MYIWKFSENKILVLYTYALVTVVRYYGVSSLYTLFPAVQRSLTDPCCWNILTKFLLSVEFAVSVNKYEMPMFFLHTPDGSSV